MKRASSSLLGKTGEVTSVSLPNRVFPALPFLAEGIYLGLGTVAQLGYQAQLRPLLAALALF